jgi:quercetin dioxygenase-like cupin family protein
MRHKKVIVGAMVVLLAGIAVGYAIAAATSSVVADTNTVREKIVQTQVSGGFESGWHVHPGPAIVQVQSGQIRIYQGSCNPNIIGPGETYIEVPGVPVDAIVKDDATWTTTFVLPNSSPGAPDRTAATSPC